MSTDLDRTVTFIEKARPPLEDGAYELTATQTVPNQNPGSFSTTSTFIVQGERFSIAPSEIDSVFPPDLASGEFEGVLPLVVLNRATLPWERGTGGPWLAVLTVDDDSASSFRLIELIVKQMTVKDLVESGVTITAQDDPQVSGTGTLPANRLSYGERLLKVLEYGQTPDDPCAVVDIPLELFNQIAPAEADLPYLAHVREVDVIGSRGGDPTPELHAVVIGNRLPKVDTPARSFLVSLEGMLDYLPGSDGRQSPAIGPEIAFVRLIVFRSWSYTANDEDQSLRRLLNALDVGTLALPTAVPDSSFGTRLAAALAAQERGHPSPADAAVLMQNALLMGYVPMNHHARGGGRTVSFYRGPLAPLPPPAATATYYSGPDAANAYNPQTGMFDVSYGAAWQIGHLLALQNAGMANELYQWKRSLSLYDAWLAEQQLLRERMQGQNLFASYLTPAAPTRDDAGSEPAVLIPANVAAWFEKLGTLQGVPFNYLVPDERMLPPESIRFFYVDAGWVDALTDGAFSVGRATVAEDSPEARHSPQVRRLARERGRRRTASEATADDAVPLTGFLLRSAAVTGWPNLRVSGFSDPKFSDPLACQVFALSKDTVMCLFDGVVASLYVREPPEQLHHGAEIAGDGSCSTTLRSLVDVPAQSITAGEQFPDHPTVVVSLRGTPAAPNGRTVDVSATAKTIAAALAARGQTPQSGVTSAEFAVEMTQGVVEVGFTL